MKSSPERYAYYVEAVQDPKQTVREVQQLYRDLRGRTARVLREDFCATFAITCEWVKSHSLNRGIGVDLDPEPVLWGFEHHAAHLTAEQRARLQVITANVTRKGLPRADVIAALNFSFFVFKQRQELLGYFQRCRETLRPQGLLVLDCFGGSETWEPNEEKTPHGKFTYYWDQVTFDPITHHSLFHIHFKPRGRKKQRKVFTYDWRMWTLPELRDLLIEAGFKHTHVYWETEDRNGEGTGIFKHATKAENCPAWVCYLVGEK